MALLLNIPPHLQCVVTLPNEIPVFYEGSLVNIIHLNYFISFLAIFLLNLLNCSILFG